MSDMQSMSDLGLELVQSNITGHRITLTSTRKTTSLQQLVAEPSRTDDPSRPWKIQELVFAPGTSDDEKRRLARDAQRALDRFTSATTLTIARAAVSGRATNRYQVPTRYEHASLHERDRTAGFDCAPGIFGGQCVDKGPGAGQYPTRTACETSGCSQTSGPSLPFDIFTGTIAPMLTVGEQRKLLTMSKSVTARDVDFKVAADEAEDALELQKAIDDGNNVRNVDEKKRHAAFTSQRRALQLILANRGRLAARRVFEQILRGWAYDVPDVLETVFGRTFARDAENRRYIRDANPWVVLLLEKERETQPPYDDQPLQWIRQLIATHDRPASYDERLIIGQRNVLLEREYKPLGGWDLGDHVSLWRHAVANNRLSNAPTVKYLAKKWWMSPDGQPTSYLPLLEALRVGRSISSLSDARIDYIAAWLLEKGFAADHLISPSSEARYDIFSAMWSLQQHETDTRRPARRVMDDFMTRGFGKHDDDLRMTAAITSTHQSVTDRYTVATLLEPDTILHAINRLVQFEYKPRTDYAGCGEPNMVRFDGDTKLVPMTLGPCDSWPVFVLRRASEIEGLTSRHMTDLQRLLIRLYDGPWQLGTRPHDVDAVLGWMTWRSWQAKLLPAAVRAFFTTINDARRMDMPWHDNKTMAVLLEKWDSATVGVFPGTHVNRALQLAEKKRQLRMTEDIKKLGSAAPVHTYYGTANDIAIVHLAFNCFVFEKYMCDESAFKSEFTHAILPRRESSVEAILTRFKDEWERTGSRPLLDEIIAAMRNELIEAYPIPVPAAAEWGADLDVDVNDPDWDPFADLA